MVNEVFVVKQYQEEEGYLGHPCAVFNTYESAKEEAAELNAIYGQNVYLDKDGQFVDVCNDELPSHYYKVESFIIDRSCFLEHDRVVGFKVNEEKFVMLSEAKEKYDEMVENNESTTLIYIYSNGVEKVVETFTSK